MIGDLMNINTVLLKFQNSNSASLSKDEYEVLRERKLVYNNHWPTGNESPAERICKLNPNGIAARNSAIQIHAVAEQETRKERKDDRKWNKSFCVAIISAIISLLVLIHGVISDTKLIHEEQAFRTELTTVKAELTTVKAELATTKANLESLEQSFAQLQNDNKTKDTIEESQPEEKIETKPIETAQEGSDPVMKSIQETDS